MNIGIYFTVDEFVEGREFERAEELLRRLDKRKGYIQNNKMKV
ncbi:hypothetical protein [Thermococcus celericrescens]|nr:hypothetical protein [Thermococcus celericrescens]